MSDEKIKQSNNLKLNTSEFSKFSDKKTIRDEENDQISLFDELEYNTENNYQSINLNENLNISDELILSLQDILDEDENKYNNQEEDDGINSTTIEREKQVRINNLDETEAAVYAQYEEVVENLDEGENVNDAIFEFMSGLSDVELKSFIQAYDYVNDKNGGMEELIGRLFNELIADELKDFDVDTLVKLDKVLSDNDKASILDYYKEHNSILPLLDRNLEALEYLLNGNSNKAKDILLNDDRNTGGISGTKNITLRPDNWFNTNSNKSKDIS